jgi:hypothetical protein
MDRSKFLLLTFLSISSNNDYFVFIELQQNAMNLGYNITTTHYTGDYSPEG